jgi:hypothetical protein
METQAAPSSKMAGFSRPKARMRAEGSKIADKPDETAASLEKLKELASQVDPAEKMDKVISPPVQDEPEQEVEAKEEIPFESDKSTAEDDEQPVVLSYEQKIEEFGLTIESAMAIVDQVTMEGYYSEKVKVGRKVFVEFMTRPTRFNTFLTDVIDKADPKKVAKLNQIMSEYQLAASLTVYGDTEFPLLRDGLSSKEWDETIDFRLKFIRSLPTHLFAALCDKLSLFDLKVTTVFSKGYDEYF